jgi:hypothetical protein
VSAAQDRRPNLTPRRKTQSRAKTQYLAVGM